MWNSPSFTSSTFSQFMILSSTSQNPNRQFLISMDLMWDLAKTVMKSMMGEERYLLFLRFTFIILSLLVCQIILCTKRVVSLHEPSQRLSDLHLLLSILFSTTESYQYLSLRWFFYFSFLPMIEYIFWMIYSYSSHQMLMSFQRLTESYWIILQVLRVILVTFIDSLLMLLAPPLFRYFKRDQEYWDSSMKSQLIFLPRSYISSTVSLLDNVPLMFRLRKNPHLFSNVLIFLTLKLVSSRVIVSIYLFTQSNSSPKLEHFDRHISFKDLMLNRDFMSLYLTVDQAMSSTFRVFVMGPSINYFVQWLDEEQRLFMKFTICCFLFQTSFTFSTSRGIRLRCFSCSIGNSMDSLSTFSLLLKIGSIHVPIADSFSKEGICLKFSY